MILSGTGNDGTAGLRDVQAAGGIAFAFHPYIALGVTSPASAAQDEQRLGQILEQLHRLIEIDFASYKHECS